jgi:hypothetical protein
MVCAEIRRLVSPSTKITRFALYNTSCMPVTIELQNIGDVPVRSEIAAIVEHVLSDRPGVWRVTILGSRANDNWEMKIEGPKGYERSYTLIGSAGEHEPQAVGNVLAKLVTAQTA